MRNVEVDVLKQLENKKYHKNYTPIIIVSIVLAFVFIIATTWGVMALLFPQKLGEIAYNINWNGYALKLYERHYDKTGDIDSLYMSVNLAIKCENDNKIIELYEEFSNNENYNSYIYYVNANNFKSNLKPVIKATMINEDNYLKNHYIQSLINKKFYDVAFTYAYSFELNLTPDYDNMGNYLFNNFCKKGVIDYTSTFFYQTSEKYDGQVLLHAVYNHMIAVNNQFIKCFDQQTYPDYANINETYIWAMGNRVLQVGSNVLSLCENLNLSNVDGIEMVDNTKTIMDNVNNKFKLLALE